MKPKKSKKEYDAVKTMRLIRDKLGEEYAKNPEKEKSDLRKIRKKYHIRSHIENSDS